MFFSVQDVTYIPHLAKIGFMISQYSVLVEMCAQLLLSINRLSAIVYPIQHNKFWTKQITLILFLSGMILSIAPTAMRATQPAAFIDVNGSYIPYLLNAGDQESLLAFHVFDLTAEAHKIVLVSLTVSADAFALSNPWLLFCLSSTFRKKFIEARKIRRIFAAAPSTNETS
uniref:G protein-coupled receptor n=3 Tax=Caenorhabditis tropicalis TaxID=1561998 RepID=A0A1I7UFU6_9PELO